MAHPQRDGEGRWNVILLVRRLLDVLGNTAPQRTIGTPQTEHSLSMMELGVGDVYI